MFRARKLYKMPSVFVEKSTFCLWTGRNFSKDLQTIPFINEVAEIFVKGRKVEEKHLHPQRHCVHDVKQEVILY